MNGSRKRVLFLIPSLVGGGAERVFTLLLRHLDREKFEPQLAVLEAGGTYTGDVPDDVVVHDLASTRVRYAITGLIRLIWKTRPDTIVSTLGHLNVAIALAKPFLPRGTKVIAREAIIVSSLLPELTKHHRIWAWLYRSGYRRADRVICLSDSMVEDMAKNFDLPRKKMVRIYNPVDVTKVNAEAAREPSPYSGSGPHLVAAGRLNRQKGFDVLLEAMPAVLAKLPTAKLYILGEGPLKEDLDAQVQSLHLADSVRLPGFQKNPWSYLKYADVFVLPSRYEGMPNVMLEAMALGTPVVATNCPGAVAEIQQMTGSVRMVPTENAHELAIAIVAACGTVNDHEKSVSVQQVAQLFDVQHVVDEYSKIF